MPETDALAPTPDSKLLSSMAVLQVNWEHQGRTYLDNFLFFVMEAMRRHPQESYTDEQVCGLLKREFALDVPDSVIHSLLRRAKRTGLGDRSKTGRFVPDSSRLNENVELAAKQAEIARQQRSLVSSYVKFAQASGRTLDGEQASVELTSFIDKFAAPILTAAHRGERPSGSTFSREEETLVAAFLEHLNESEPIEFEYLVTIAKGAMLASSLFREDITPLDDRFENTDLYLDTPVLFRCLGFFGQAAQSAQLSLIAASASFGARVRAFEQTVHEARSVIEAVANRLRNSTFSPDERDIGFHFVQKGFSAEEVRSVAASFERDIKRLGVEIVERPAKLITPVDEVALGNLLMENRPAYPKSALAHDVEVLVWIRSIRRGRAGDRLERSRATFVTTNPRLIAGAEDFPAFSGERYPLAAFEDRVATLVWLKTPLAYPDLPRDQLIARVAALLSPTKQVWAKYLEQIERLRSRGAIEAADEILLRQHYEAGRALVDETANDVAVVSEDSVTRVLERVKKEIARPHVVKAEQQSADASLKQQALESDLAIAKAEAEALQIRLSERFRRIADVLSSVVYWAVVGVSVAFIVLSWWLDWSLISVGVQVLVLVGLVFGSLASPIKRLKELVARAIERSLRRISGLN